MDTRRRSDRFAMTMSPEFFRMANIRRGMWHETPEEIEAGLEWGRRKAELLRWVRRQIGRTLTPRERRCLTLYFFRGMTFPEVAEATGMSLPAAHRAVARSLRKLRATAQRSTRRSQLAKNRKARDDEEPA